MLVGLKSRLPTIVFKLTKMELLKREEVASAHVQSEKSASLALHVCCYSCYDFRYGVHLLGAAPASPSF